MVWTFGSEASSASRIKVVCTSAAAVATISDSLVGSAICIAAAAVTSDDSSSVVVVVAVATIVLFAPPLLLMFLLLQLMHVGRDVFECCIIESSNGIVECTVVLLVVIVGVSHIIQKFVKMQYDVLTSLRQLHLAAEV